MIIPILKFCHKSTLVFIEIAVAIFFVLLGMMCVVFWKFSQGPVDVTFAADTVKQAIVSSDHKTDFKFDSIIAEWPEFSGPISIGLSGVKLFENNKPVLTIPQLGIRIAKAPLLVGLIKPEAVIAKDATIKLYRSKAGGIHLLLGDGTADTIEKQTPNAQEKPVEAGFKVLGEALFRGGNLPDYHEIQPLSKMERFSVNNAHLIIVDEMTGKGWNIPQLDIELLRKPDEFTIETRYKGGDNQETNISFLLSRDVDTKEVSFKSAVDRINVSVLGQLFLPVQPTRGPQFIVKGNVVGTMDGDWNVQKLDGEIASEQGIFNLDGLFDTPLRFSKLAAYVTYDRASQKIILHDTHVDINNRTLQFSGEKLSDAKSNVFPLMVNVPEITFDEIQALWPDAQKETLAADWLTKRLSKAKVKNLKAMVPIEITQPDKIDSEAIEASFDFENLTADYRAPLIAVTEAKGKASLKKDFLLIEVSSGKLADMALKNGTVGIAHLTHPTLVGDVTIDANAVGNISTVLDYIGREPISLGKKIGIDPKSVKGTTDLNVKVTFPALKDLPVEDVKVLAEAKLNNLVLPSIVRGMDLTGDGLALSVKEGSVVISGKGALGGQPIDMTYTAYLDLAKAPYVSEIKADVVADKALREKFGVHLDQFVEGNVPVKISYQENKNGDETVAIDADVTTVVVKFSPFEYRKPEGKAGNATCNVLIQKGEVRYIKDLKLSIDKGGSANGNIYFGKVGNINDVKFGKFSSFTMAGANNFALDFTQTSPNAFDIAIKGKQLDGRPFLGGKATAGAGGSKDEGTPTAVNAVVDVAQIKTGNDADQLLMKPTLSLKTNVAGDVTFLDLRGSFKDGTLSVSMKPDDKGKTQMKISSDNAGGALHILDVYDQMSGGTMDIRGSQIAGGGVNDIAGRGQINNFTVVRAPVLAKLINLFSLSGLTELLQNKGIGFEKLRTDFEWKQMKSGRVISLLNGRTSGSSIGLTFGGTVNQDKGTMDISGTFVPMSEINGFFNKIPVIGGLLTGGKNGGVIAATYAMNGRTEDPSVFINPLSVLTPGFLRSFLFENNTTIFDNGGDEEKTRKPEKKGLNN